MPVGVSVQLEMISEDVIHSYFIPAFRVKQDVLRREQHGLTRKDLVQIGARMEGFRADYDDFVADARAARDAQGGAERVRSYTCVVQDIESVAT